MTLAHEHVLGCQRCKSPLFVTGSRGPAAHGAKPRNTRLVLTYEQTVASILEFESPTATASFLHAMRDDTVDSGSIAHTGAPAARWSPSSSPSSSSSLTVATTLHVLHMEGFETPETRRDFAAHCGLDEDVFEQHFVAMSRWTGAAVGACWCTCHASSGAETEEGEGEKDGMEGRPLTPRPIVVGMEQAPQRKRRRGRTGR